MTPGKLFPHPLMTAVLTVAWMLLVESASLGSLCFGLLLGTSISLLTAQFWPNRPRLRRPGLILEYVAVVVRDIVLANIEVARIVLFKKNSELRPAFMAIPLELTSPEAITVLAGTITMTPGTLSADLSADGRTLLIHGLDVPDPDAVVADIKQRYEKRLREIFA